MNKSHVAIATVVAAAALACQAHASDYLFNFGDSTVGGSIDITYTANPNTGVIPGNVSPNTVDPIGSFIVTKITGTFTDMNVGISDDMITGRVLSDPGLPTPTNFFAPASFGFYPVANGVPGPGPSVAPGFSYDNLFYPDGSPRSSTDYPIHGGVLDIYGVVFTLQGGNSVNLWSNGDFGNGIITYGVGVTDGTNVLDYESVSGSVPEPASWALMLIGVAGVGGAMRALRRSAASSVA